METAEVTIPEVFKILENVKDPEIPVISVIDMGMITDVQLQTKSNFQTAVITLAVYHSASISVLTTSHISSKSGFKNSE